SQAAATHPDSSVAPLCTGWAGAGQRPPQRVAAIWPARCWPPRPGLDRSTPGWRILSEDPPAVWWGWTGRDQAIDWVRYAGVRRRLHDFLDKIPLDPPPLR